MDTISQVLIYSRRIGKSIRRHLPEFTCDFVPDVRQDYADSWPNDIDDDVARTEWGWVPEYDLDATVDAMFAGLQVE